MKKLLFLLMMTCLPAGLMAENEKSTLSVLLEKVKLTGYGQVGYTYNSFDPAQEGKESNTFDIKRIMFMAEGQITSKLTLYFMYDFANARLHEYWGEYSFHPAFKLRIGQFKAPFTIESPMSPATLQIISGAQSVQYLAGISAADVCYTGQAGRDLGIMASGDFFPYKSWKLLGYKIGIFNGQGMNVKDKNKYKDVVGTISINPLEQLMLAGSFYIGHGYASADNPFGAFGKGENYRRNRWSAGAEVKTRPLYLRSEYIEGTDGGIKSRGAYATAAIHVHPKVDIIASYDYFNKCTATCVEQTNYIVGAQWWLYRRCRLQAQYVFQDRGEGNHNANLVMAQLQLGF